MSTVLLPRSLHEKPWGRIGIPSCFEAGTSKIGEAWFDNPEHPLPLLVKWLFTSERLSIQVHPDDQQARLLGLPSGKEEWWLVVDAKPGACLGIGTTRPLDAVALQQAARDGSLEHLMEWRPVRRGDWFHVPPGTVHAIGAGVTLVEIQQYTDATFRLYDYGRPRELHLDVGVGVSRAGPYTDSRHGSVSLDGRLRPGVLSSCGHFEIILGCGPEAQPDRTGPAWIIPLRGCMRMTDFDVLPGNVAFGILGNKAIYTNDFIALFAFASADTFYST